MDTKTIQTKICIIGAGPAGATTSLFLSKFKVPHVIVDAATFPRDKVCGDALDLKVLRVLNQLDPIIVEEILQDENFTKSWGASVILSKTKKYNFDFDKHESKLPFMLVSKRAYFDNFLVSKIDSAYADFRQATKVKSCERLGNEWLIKAQSLSEDIEINADFIVGADGDHSTLLRSLGERKIERKNYAGALRQYWTGISDINPNNHVEIYLPKSLPLAYLWIFPLPNGEANVGLGLGSDVIAKKNIDLKKLLNQLITEDYVIKNRFANAQPLEKPVGWGLPLASQKRKTNGTGYLLVGDAASLISPTTGEGIGPAMMSAFIAATFIERSYLLNDFGERLFSNYESEIHKRLASEVKKYKLVKRISPMLYNWMLNLLSISGVGKYYFNRNRKKWVRTASKNIEVELV